MLATEKETSRKPEDWAIADAMQSKYTEEEHAALTAGYEATLKPVNPYEVVK